MDCADPAGLMSGCTSVFQIEEPHPTPTPPKGDPQTVQKYTVTKSTGLYELPQVDSQMITELSAGTQLMSAEGNLYLDCRELTDASLPIKLCKMEVVNIGKTGWVLAEWFEE
jgi:hypothetical protein